MAAAAEPAAGAATPPAGDGAAKDRPPLVTEGGAVGIDASDGSEMWTVPGTREAEGASYPAPVIEGDVAYLPGHDGVIAVRLSSGGRPWKEAGTGKQVQGLAVLDGVLVTSQQAPKGMSTVRAVRTASDRRELWSFEDEWVFDIAVLDGRAYLAHALAPSDPSTGYAADVSAVGLHSGERTGRARCRDFAVRGDWLVRWDLNLLTGQKGAVVLTSDTLEKHRTLAADMVLRAPPVLDDDGTVLLSREDGRLVRYDLASGEQLWDRQAVVDGSDELMVLAGDRLVVPGAGGVSATPAGDPDGLVNRRIFESESRGKDTEGPVRLIVGLIAGGVVFLVHSDGVAISGYLPG